MVNYKELGLVNTREMFKKAVAGGYAIPAFNFNTMEQMQAIVQAAVETKSPVIMQVSKGARNYANGTILRYMAQGAVEYAKELGCEKPEIVLHLDHGDSFEICKECIDNGFSSVMIDGSSLPYEENIALTKKVVEYAHKFDVTVEAELGVLAGVEDEVSSAVSHYTKPEEVIDFLNSLPAKTKAKIMFNVGKARYNLDPKLFKKLVGTDIWEFRTLYNGLQYRLLAFWDNNTNTYVITTHGFVKKTQKTPQKEIDRAIAIRNEYYKK